MSLKRRGRSKKNVSDFTQTLWEQRAEVIQRQVAMHGGIKTWIKSPEVPGLSFEQNQAYKMIWYPEVHEILKSLNYHVAVKNKDQDKTITVKCPNYIKEEFRFKLRRID